MIKKLQSNKDKIAISLIILLAAFLRLYKINGFMEFLGDQGRDVLIAYNILHGHLTLLGPTASVGGFFLGPIYYYFIAVFLLIFRFDPVGPAIMVALFGILCVYLIYRFGNELFGKGAGLIAALLFAVSPLVVTYAKFSWNPNLMPITTLLLMYFLYKGVYKNNLKFLLLSGILFGICMQLHYLELFIGVVAAFYIFLGNAFFTKLIWSKKLLQIIKSYAVYFFGFIIGFSPFLLFEVRHNFVNIRNIIQFIFHSPNTGSGNYLGIVSDIFFRVFARLLVNFPSASDYHLYNSSLISVSQIAIILLSLVSIIALLKVKNKLVALLFFLWLVLSVLLFGFYKKSIYDYYFEFLYPVPFILLGNLFYLLFKNASKIGKTAIIFIVAILFLYNLYFANPLFAAPNYQKDQAKKIADFVMKQAGGKPFNFALLTAHNSDYSYRFFFVTSNDSPIEILNPAQDPNRKSVTSQLLVVCESLPCSPLDNPLWEIAGFGQAKIANHWRVSVVEVYKLIHTK